MSYAKPKRQYTDNKVVGGAHSNPEWLNEGDKDL